MTISVEGFIFAVLASFVAETSHARFTGMAGLRFKTWRQVPAEWFEGCYVFATSEATGDPKATADALRAAIAASPVTSEVSA